MIRRMLVCILHGVFVLLLFGCSDNSTDTESAWEVSYSPGHFDTAGNFISGSEIMSLVAHKGCLYAAVGVWRGINVPVLFHKIGPQILVKESADAPWKLDCRFERTDLRVEALSSVTFTTDGMGNRLAEPVSLLIATVLDTQNSYGTASVFSRDDATGQWTRMNLFENMPSTFGIHPRAIGFHQDTVTGIDAVYVGCQPGGIYRGVYDADASGKIRWDAAPEFEGYEERVISFGVCNNRLYASIDPAIYCRTDGPAPGWERVYDYADDEWLSPEGGSAGMRGLTAIPHPLRDSGEALLMALEGFESRIVWIDPFDNYRATVELDLISFLDDQWNGTWGLWLDRQRLKYAVAAYNDMTSAIDPETGDPVLLIGLLAVQNADGHRDSSWYLVRRNEKQYELMEIPSRGNTAFAHGDLLACRTIAHSPFPDDDSDKIYFGGFDAQAAGRDCRNTAWIYRTDIYTALGMTAPSR